MYDNTFLIKRHKKRTMECMTKVDTDPKKIEEILTRSVEEIIPSKEELKKKLLSGERMRFYIGTDATGASLHLGHSTNYIILEKLRRIGHEVIFLIGDFTSRIGDPTDKDDSARKQLTREEVMEHTKTWLDQVRPVIDIDNKDNPVKILYNHDWLSKLNFEDILHIASNFTVQHMIERDMFQKRMADGKPLYLHELFYPLMQGYDSVEMDVDAELCGMDQKFNALAGRTLLKRMKDKEKFVFITTLLENPVTGEKMMSKSKGTGVFLDVSAHDMYGGVMAQADENMRQLFVDCTYLPMEDIEEILTAENPRDAKMRLAKEIVTIYHGEPAAQAAEDTFVQIFQQKGSPDEIPEFEVEEGEKLLDFLLRNKLIESKSEGRRLLEQGGIKVNGEMINEEIVLTVEVEIRVGKRRWAIAKIAK
jgi:tyrosyl-tRNA synthetase